MTNTYTLTITVTDTQPGRSRAAVKKEAERLYEIAGHVLRDEGIEVDGLVVAEVIV